MLTHSKRNHQSKQYTYLLYTKIPIKCIRASYTPNDVCVSVATLQLVLEYAFKELDVPYREPTHPLWREPMTLLDNAVESRRVGLVSLLLGAGADPNGTHNHPIRYAVTYKCHKVVELLISAGAQVNKALLRDYRSKQQ